MQVYVEGLRCGDSAGNNERDGLAGNGHRYWNRRDLKREIRAEGGRGKSGQKEPCSTINRGFATMAAQVRLQQNNGKVRPCRN